MGFGDSARTQVAEEAQSCDPSVQGSTGQWKRARHRFPSAVCADAVQHPSVEGASGQEVFAGEANESSHGLRSSPSLLPGKRGQAQSYDPLVLTQMEDAGHECLMGWFFGREHSSVSRMVKGTWKHREVTSRPNSSTLASPVLGILLLLLVNRVTVVSIMCSPTRPCKSAPVHSTSTSTTPSSTRLIFSTTTGS